MDCLKFFPPVNREDADRDVEAEFERLLREESLSSPSLAPSSSDSSSNSSSSAPHLSKQVIPRFFFGRSRSRSRSSSSSSSRSRSSSTAAAQ